MSQGKSKIHVLFLPLWYPNKYDPMPGLFIERHAKAASLYCEISVLYIHPDSNQKEKYLISETRDEEMYTVKLYFKQTKLQFPFLSQLIKGIKFLNASFYGYRYFLKNKNKPDIIHVNILTRLGIFALLLKTLYKIPYIITEHWSRYLPKTGTYSGILRKALTRLIVKKASSVTTVTKNLQNAMLGHKLHNKNYIVTPNVVNTDTFIPSANKSEQNLKQIVHVSCFDDKPKNISGILRVIKRLSEIRQDFTCNLVGDGPDYLKIMSYSEELGIKDQFVFFTGLKEDEELVRIINSSDIMLLFSNYENLPVVITESFSCGIPVISTAVGGIPEHLNNERGILVEPGNEDDLLNKLNNILNNLDSYNKEKIRQYAIDNFSYQKVGKLFFDIYSKITNKS